MSLKANIDRTLKFARSIKRRTILQTVFIVFFMLSLIVPIAFMLFNMTAEGIHTALTSSMFLPALGNSVLTSICATIISLALAFISSYCVERTAIRAKSLWSIIFFVPMLIPSISHAFGLITLFGNNGIISNLFNIDSNLYGYVGIIFGSVMYSFPVAFLMISSILRYEDSMQYKAAKILGISMPRRFCIITFPFLKKTLISTIFAVFTMIITDYGVPLTIGGKVNTLSTLMYNTAVSNANYNVGSVIGVILLIPAVLAFIVDVLNPEKYQNSFVTEPMDSCSNTWIKVAAYFFCILVSIFILMPIIAFCVMSFAEKYPVNMTFTFNHIHNTFTRGAGEFLGYSLLYSILVAFFGTFVAFICAYSTARLKGKMSKPLHFIAMISMAIPGLVLGLSYVIMYNGTFIYGTIFIVVLVNSMHFFSSPYLMIYNTLSKMNENLEDVGLSLGIPRWRIVFNVILPIVLMTLLEMAIYFFVNTMMTISAISFLAPPAPQSVALMINRFEAQMLMESAAFVSLLILFVNMLVKGTFSLVKSILYKKKNRAQN